MHRKKPCVGGAPPFKTYFIGRASSGRDRNLWSKTDSQLLLSALSAPLENRASLKLGATSKELAALTSRPSLNIEPTSSQISEETLESLKLREKNFERQTTPEPTKQQQKDIPRVTSRNDTRNSLEPQRSFQLKSRYQTTSILLNRVVFISTVKTLDFST